VPTNHVLVYLAAKLRLIVEVLNAQMNPLNLICTEEMEHTSLVRRLSSHAPPILIQFFTLAKT